MQRIAYFMIDAGTPNRPVTMIYVNDLSLFLLFTKSDRGDIGTFAFFSSNPNLVYSREALNVRTEIAVARDYIKESFFGNNFAMFESVSFLPCTPLSTYTDLFEEGALSFVNLNFYLSTLAELSRDIIPTSVSCQFRIKGSIGAYVPELLSLKEVTGDYFAKTKDTQLLNYVIKQAVWYGIQNAKDFNSPSSVSVIILHNLSGLAAYTVDRLFEEREDFPEFIEINRCPFALPPSAKESVSNSTRTNSQSDIHSPKSSAPSQEFKALQGDNIPLISTNDLTDLLPVFNASVRSPEISEGVNSMIIDSNCSSGNQIDCSSSMTSVEQEKDGSTSNVILKPTYLKHEIIRTLIPLNSPIVILEVFDFISYSTILKRRRIIDRWQTLLFKRRRKEILLQISSPQDDVSSDSASEGSKSVLCNGCSSTKPVSGKPGRVMEGLDEVSSGAVQEQSSTNLIKYVPSGYIFLSSKLRQKQQKLPCSSLPNFTFPFLPSPCVKHFKIQVVMHRKHKFYSPKNLSNSALLDSALHNVVLCAPIIVICNMKHKPQALSKSSYSVITLIIIICSFRHKPPDESIYAKFDFKVPIIVCNCKHKPPITQSIYHSSLHPPLNQSNNDPQCFTLQISYFNSLPYLLGELFVFQSCGSLVCFSLPQLRSMRSIRKYHFSSSDFPSKLFSVNVVNSLYVSYVTLLHLSACTVCLIKNQILGQEFLRLKTASFPLINKFRSLILHFFSLVNDFECLSDFFHSTLKFSGFPMFNTQRPSLIRSNQSPTFCAMTRLWEAPCLVNVLTSGRKEKRRVYPQFVSRKH
jgi:hypothetical protein